VTISDALNKGLHDIPDLVPVIILTIFFFKIFAIYFQSYSKRYIKRVTISTNSIIYGIPILPLKVAAILQLFQYLLV
jgi:hypothetical protein